MDPIEQKREQLKAVLLAAQAIAAKADEEKRDFTDDERATVTAKTREAEGLIKDLKRQQADAKVRATLAGLGDDIALADPAAKQAPAGRQRLAGKSLGGTFVDSPEYKELMASVPGGSFSKQHRVQTRPVGYERLLSNRGEKALLTGLSETAAGSLVPNDYIGLQVGMDVFQRPLMLRDLVTPGTTTSDTVEYVRVTAATNNAAAVAEATTTSTGTKSESSMATVKVTSPVRTIAHWIPITKRALSDAAQVRTLIDNFLEYGLEEELEDQMIAGDGNGENFTGLAATSGVQTQAWDTSMLTTLRKAKTKVRTVGRSIATGYVLNPADVESLDLLTDNEARYYFGGPSGTIQAPGNTSPLWNLPVIETEAVAAGVGYVGDWRKCILWDREQSSITMSDSHASFFIQNLVAILAEMRAAFGVIQPSAFVSIDLTA